MMSIVFLLIAIVILIVLFSRKRIENTLPTDIIEKWTTTTTTIVDDSQLQYAKPVRPEFIYNKMDYPSLTRDKCPYCDHSFGKTPSRNRKCPKCQQFIIRAVIPIQPDGYDVVLLNESEGWNLRGKIDQYWSDIFSKKKPINEIESALDKAVREKRYHDAKMLCNDIVNSLTENTLDKQCMQKASLYAKNIMKFETMHYLDSEFCKVDELRIIPQTSNIEGCKYATKRHRHYTFAELQLPNFPIPCAICTANNPYTCYIEIIIN